MNASHSEYIARINRVKDFVKANLDGDLSLEKLAQVACFSKFYFARIFAAITGETLNVYVARSRVEKAAYTLTRVATIPITNLAYDHGFSSPAVFARAFRDRYGMTPSEWRFRQKSKICKVNSNLCEALRPASIYIDSHTQNPTWRFTMTSNSPLQIDVRNMPAITIAYLRHSGAYDPSDKLLFQSLFSRLMNWAIPKNLFLPPQTKAMTIFSSGHPDTTAPENLSVDVAISVEGQVKVSGEVSKRTIPAGTYAVVCLEEATLEECRNGWDMLFNNWLPESGYQPGDGAYYINHLNDPEQHPRKLHRVEMYLPVKPLQ